MTPVAESCTTLATILITDGCKELCELMKIILCRIGFDVRTVNDGESALEAAHTLPSIDLLITESKLRDMGGAELALRFAVLHPLTPVIVTTDSTQTCVRPIFSDILLKPFSITALRSIVHRALSLRLSAFHSNHAA